MKGKKGNPFAKVGYASAGRDVQVATNMRLPGQSGMMVGNNGEVNASSQADLMAQVAKLMEVAANTHVMTEEQAVSKQELAAAHRNQVLAAFDNAEKLSELGEVLAEELYITGNREGFARRFLARQELTQGQLPQARVRMKNVVAVTSASATRVESQLVRDNDIFPPEFYISARPYIEKRDIDRSNTDILEEKYIEALESIMVGEDRSWRNMADATVGAENDMTNVAGTLGPASLGAIRNQVTRWGIPARFWLIANDLWSDLTSNTEWSGLINPVAQHELLLTGQLGTVLGMEVISDAFRHEQHKVLSAGEMYVIGAPENHGQYTDRGGIESQPLDGSQESIPGRGWFMNESVSMLIANARSVAKGKRA